MFVSLNFCLKTVQESSAELGSHSHTHQGCGMCAVCFQRTPRCGVSAFWGNSLWLAMVYPSLVPTPPECCRFSLPSYQRSSQHPPPPRLHPDSPDSSGLASRRTAKQRRTAVTAGRSSPAMAQPPRPTRQLAPAGPRRRAVPRGWHCVGTMARFSALPKSRRSAGTCALTLSLLPRARGCSGRLGRSQHRNTSPRAPCYR